MSPAAADGGAGGAGAPGRAGAGAGTGTGAAGVRTRRPEKNSFRIRASSTASANRTGISRRSSSATSTSSTFTIWSRRAMLAEVSVTISRFPCTRMFPPWTNGRSVTATRSAGACCSGTIWVITSSSRRVGSACPPMMVGRGRSRTAVVGRIL
jgi:hypothetical protein